VRLVYWLETIIAYLLYFSGLYWARKRSLDRREALVVIVYHRVTPGAGRLGEMVGEQSLDRQMRYIRRHSRPVDWRELTENDAIDGNGRRKSDRPGLRVLVTFDDGYRDTFTRALPILERNGIPSIVFAPTDFVFGGKYPEGEGDEVLAPTADDLRAAVESPLVTLGNHTASHSIVSTLSPDDFDRELGASQEAFLSRLGIRPEVFAYPRGRKSDLMDGAAPVLREHGFRMAFTMVPGIAGPGTDRYLIPRIGMSHVNDPVLFKVKLTGLLNALVTVKNFLGL
jgi:peptidoglycan/xylan/chitin deacetylase (PgdA/CDA1 family)